MYQEVGTLTPTPPFDFDKSLQFLGIFGPTKNEQTVSTQSLTKAISFNGQTVVFQLTSIGTTENPSLEYTLFSADPFSKATKNAVVERITFFLSLKDDLAPFYRIGREDADFTPIIEHLHGYHQVKFLTPFETACWAVLTQRNPMKIAQKTKQALVERYGNSFEVNESVYWAFPELFQIAVVDESELLKVIRNDRRTEYLIAIARAFSEVDEEFLKSAPDEEVEMWLRNIKGIGEWSATFIMVRGLGRMERVPLTETRLIKAASKVYGRGEELSRNDLKRLTDKYGPWQGYWAHYIRVAS
jgi:DNA-3-methyladenine glycosylase II